MPKIPRDISGKELAILLKRYRYELVREKGSHLRLVSDFKGVKHKITIPNHHSIKIGILNNILCDLAEYLKTPKETLVDELF